MDGHTSSSILSITVSNAFDRLIAYDVKAQPRPMLAESWDVSSDFKEVKLNLRKGVTWHNGRELTSEDVKFNLLRGQDPKVATGSYVNQAKWFSSMETPDKYTVVMRSDVSRPAVFDYFNVLNMVEPESTDRPGCEEHRRGHRSVHACRMGAGQSHHVRQKSELLAIGQAVCRSHRHLDHS